MLQSIARDGDLSSRLIGVIHLFIVAIMFVSITTLTAYTDTAQFDFVIAAELNLPVLLQILFMNRYEINPCWFHC